MNDGILSFASVMFIVSVQAVSRGDGIPWSTA